jgi:hypothetical protein
MGEMLAIADEARVLELIPQQQPFVLVHALISAAPTEFITSFTVRQEHVLVENGRLTEAGLMENVAQSAALGIGYQAHAAGHAAPLGFIGSIGHVTITDRPRVGDRIVTTVLVRHQVANVHVIEGSVHLGEQLLANMELKVVIMDTSAML